MDNPASTVKTAVRSITPKFVIAVGLVIVGGLFFLDWMDWTPKALRPLTAIKDWNEKRKAAAAAKAS